MFFAFACLPFMVQAQQVQSKAVTEKVTPKRGVNRSEATVKQQGNAKTTTSSIEIGSRRKVENITVEAARERKNVVPKAIDAAGREVYQRDEDN